MSALLLYWIGVGILFLIVEMVTTAFYGLALALSSFVVAIYVWLTGEVQVSIIQGLIFALISTLGAYFFPKMLDESTEEVPQWLDIYLGQTRKVKKVGEDFKVVLDGIDYFVEIDGLKAGDQVRLTSRHGSIFHGEIL
jgi:membrane protein implicated in regulation of membrane protease activity